MASKRKAKAQETAKLKSTARTDKTGYIDEVLKPSVRLSHKQSLGSCNSGGNKQ